MGTKNIKKDTSLRKAILQAAITGQLEIGNVQCAISSGQLGISETGKQLLDRIIAERNAKALAEWGEKVKVNAKAKKPAPIVASEIDADDVPFEIPDDWCWCRLGDVAEIKSSKRVFEKDYTLGGIPFFRSAEIGDLQQKKPLKTELFISINHFEELKMNYGVPKKGDLLITSVGTIGNTWISDGRDFYYKDGNITQICKSDFIISEFFRLFIDSPIFTMQVFDTVAGTAYNALTIIKLKKLLFPLPPLAVQKAIVAKLEAVLPLVEIYENAVLQKEELKNTLSDKVKKAILQEAVTGQLEISSGQLGIGNVQCAIGETGKELLERIIAERNAQALAEWEEKVKVNAKAKKPAPIVASKIDEDEIPFEIPDDWCWCRLGDVGDFVRGKGFVKSDFVENGFPCIHYGQIHMKFGYETEHEITYIPNEVAKKSSIAQTNDIIIAITSEDELASCKATVWKGEYDIAVGSHTAIYHQYVNPSYIIYYLFSNIFYSQKIKYTHGSKVVEIKPSDIASCLIPLPPLAEQEAIVAKIEQLLPLCKQLEN